jgi:hypothetical protein
MTNKFLGEGDMLNMKYVDKNGEEWSIDKGDWVGSYERETKLSKSNFLTSFIFPVVIVTIVAILLISQLTN